MSNENLAPNVVMRIVREIKSLVSEMPEGVHILTNDEDVTDVRAVIAGPAGTPYEGGEFHMKLVLCNDFPQAPPKGFFITKIFHPNVSSSGEICVNTLKKDWKPDLGMKHILLTVKCLLIYPNPESALNEEAGKLLLERYEEYAKHARLMTDIYAKPKGNAVFAKAVPPAAGDDSAAENDGTADDPSPKKRKEEKKPAAADKKKEDKKRSLKRL
eukprot:Opistho-2@58293